MNAMSTEMRGIRVRGLPRPAVAGAHNAAPLDSLLRSIRGPSRSADGRLEAPFMV